VEKLEQHDGGDLAAIVGLAPMSGPAIAEIMVRIRIRAPALTADSTKAHTVESMQNERRKIEIRPRPRFTGPEKSLVAF
jgi:hypothetical protein